MTTIVISKPTLTFGKAMPVTSETAFIAPSPASGMILGGKYMKIPKAMITVEINIINRRITKFSGVGKKETPQLQKVVKYPKTIPTRT